MPAGNFTLVDHVGDYIAIPWTWATQPSHKTPSVCLFIRWAIQRELVANGQIIDYTGRLVDVPGKLWIIGKDGEPNVDNVQVLRTIMGWTGRSLRDFNREGTWKPNPCRITVQKDREDGSLQARWINPVEGRFERRVSPERLDEIAEINDPKLCAVIDALDQGLPIPKIQPMDPDNIPF